MHPPVDRSPIIRDSCGALSALEKIVNRIARPELRKERQHLHQSERITIVCFGNQRRQSSNAGRISRKNKNRSRSVFLLLRSKAVDSFGSYDLPNLIKPSAAAKVRAVLIRRDKPR